MENAIDKRFERQETAFVSSQKAAIKLLAQALNAIRNYRQNL